MFTGLIEDVATLASRVPDEAGGAARLRLESPRLTGLDLGESIACDGCCLTVTSKGPGWFEALAGPETLSLTTLGSWQPGRRVNVERALQASARLGGHIVAGHVDGVASVEARAPRGAATDFTIAPPPALLRYVVAKGSICVDGISLTVNTVDEYAFTVSIIPHTLEHTALGDRAPGDHVNLEVDVIGKYVEKLLGGYR
jgi:riboflavin synthase